MTTRSLFGIVMLLLSCRPAIAEDSPTEMLARLLRDLPSKSLTRSNLGLTRKETPIPCLFTADDLDVNTPRTRVLLIGGLDGSASSVEAVMGCLRWYWTADEAKRARERFALSAVPCANPDGWAAGKG